MTGSVYSPVSDARPSPAGIEPSIEPIRESVLPQLIDVHMDAFGGYMNASIGRAYVHGVLAWFSRRRDGIALAALIDGRAVGYVVGAPVGYERSMNRDLLWTAASGFALRPWLLFEKRFAKRIRQRARQFLASDGINTRSVPGLPQPVMSLVGIGVAADARRSGVGKALLTEFERRCRQARMRSIRLSVYAPNRPARVLYERSGWALFVPGEGAEAVYYYRILDSAHP